jgi:hypothetical protein
LVAGSQYRTRQWASTPQARRTPEVVHVPGFDATMNISMRQQWFTHVRLLVAHLPCSWQGFCRNAHHPGSQPAQLAVVWALRLRDEPERPTFIKPSSPAQHRS